MYPSCGFQSKLKVQSSLARVVTVDNEVATNSRMLHTLIVIAVIVMEDCTKNIRHKDENRYTSQTEAIEMLSGK